MHSRPNLPEEGQIMVEERIFKANGDTTVRKYIKGRFLGKGGFARCYEFINAETKKMCAAKIIDKATLTKNRAKQKVNFSLIPSLCLKFVFTAPYIILMF